MRKPSILSAGQQSEGNPKRLRHVISLRWGHDVRGRGTITGFFEERQRNEQAHGFKFGEFFRVLRVAKRFSSLRFDFARPQSSQRRPIHRQLMREKMSLRQRGEVKTMPAPGPHEATPKDREGKITTPTAERANCEGR